MRAMTEAICSLTGDCFPQGRCAVVAGGAPRNHMFTTEGQSTMIKVRLSPSILEYQLAMAELVDEVSNEYTITGVDYEDIQDFRPPREDFPEFGTPGLLLPPKIEMLLPDFTLEDGRLDGIIHIHTSEYFGVMSVYVVLEDDQGNQIESDYAMENELMRNHWCYIPSSTLVSGASVTVRAIAIDPLGGVGIHIESVTI